MEYDNKDIDSANNYIMLLMKTLKHENEKLIKANNIINNYKEDRNKTLKNKVKEISLKFLKLEYLYSEKLILIKDLRKELESKNKEMENSKKSKQQITHNREAKEQKIISEIKKCLK